MAVINRLTKAQIREYFTHTGWFMGVVPVYIGDPGSPCPALAARNWVPEWWFDAVEGLSRLTAAAMTLVYPDYEAPYQITVTGEIS